MCWLSPGHDVGIPYTHVLSRAVFSPNVWGEGRLDKWFLRRYDIFNKATIVNFDRSLTS